MKKFTLFTVLVIGLLLMGVGCGGGRAINDEQPTEGNPNTTYFNDDIGIIDKSNSSGIIAPHATTAGAGTKTSRKVLSSSVISVLDGGITISNASSAKKRNVKSIDASWLENKNMFFDLDA